MATSVDMSLDDIIKSNRERVRGRSRGGGGRGRGRGRGRGHGPSGYLRGVERMTGPVRRGNLAVNARPSSYMIAKPARRTRSFPWQHDLFEDSLRAAGISGVEFGTKLNVSNLDSGVSNEDIRELFAEIGDLERYAIHYDKNGRPGGSAEVVYTRRSDAFAALKRYNNVLLDGKPMKLEVVGANVEIPVSARVNVTGENGRRKRTVVMTPGAGLNGGGSSINRGSGQNRRWAMRSGRGAMGNDRGYGAIGNGRGHGAMGNGRGHGAMGNGRGRGAARGWGQGRVRGRGRGRGRKQPVDQSADDLNDDLEKYHAEAMQT